MKYYLEIKFVDSNFFNKNVTLNSIHGYLHSVYFIQRKFSLSFPGYTKHGLGNIIRIFGDDHDSLAKMKDDLENRYNDFADFELSKTPENVSFVRFIRSREIEKKTRRKRKDDSIKVTCNLPYIICNSRSTGMKFGLYIEKCTAGDSELPSTYGLGKMVPDF